MAELDIGWIAVFVCSCAAVFTVDLLIKGLRAAAGGRQITGPTARSPEERARHRAAHLAAWQAQEAALGLPFRAGKDEENPTVLASGPAPGQPTVRLWVEIRAPSACEATFWPRAERGEVYELRGQGTTPAITLRASTRAPMPAALDIRREGLGSELAAAVLGADLQTGNAPLDAKALIRGDEQTRQLLADDAVQQALLQALSHPGRFHWVGDGASLRLDPAEIVRRRGSLERKEVTAAALDLARLLGAAADAGRAAWAAAAEDTGLALSDRDRRPALSGTLEGHRIEVRATGLRSGLLRVRLGQRAHGLALSGDAPTPERDLLPVRMPNPVLGAALKARARDPERAARLLGREAVATAAIGVLRSHEGSRVSPDGWLIVPLADVGVASAEIRDAVHLAQLLSAP